MGALTLTDSKAKYHKGFGPLLPGVLHAPYAGPRRTASGDRDTATVDFLREVLFRYEVDPRSRTSATLWPRRTTCLTA